MWLLVSGESGMGDALESAAVVENNKLTGTVSGLLPSTKYYFCFRYNTGVNLDNTESGSFTTQSSGGGTGELAVTTLSVTSITTTTAVSGGNVTGDGGHEVTMRGVCWNTSGDPTVADNHTEDGTGTGVFLNNMLDLEAATEYHVRAYAINEIGIAYGEEIGFTTLSVDNQWIYYDNGVHTDNIGTGDSYSDERWGSMFPASMIGHYIGGRITKVALYESNNNVGSILLNIYIGGSDKPGTLVHTQSFNPESTNALHEIVLNTPVQITSAQNLWITFGQIGDPYPICACSQTGIPNNRWLSSDGGNTWHDVATQGLTDSGWMIRGYLMFDDKEIMFGH